MDNNYYVSMGNSMLKEEAQARGVDIVIVWPYA